MRCDVIDVLGCCVMVCTLVHVISSTFRENHLREVATFREQIQRLETRIAELNDEKRKIELEFQENSESHDVSSEHSFHTAA